MNKEEISIIKKSYLCINYNKSTFIKSIQKEKELSINLHVRNDLLSAKKLITYNLKYVVKLSKKYVKYSLNLIDLIQEGTIGLMKAVKKFNPKKGIKLLSFAIHWIKSEIHEYIIKNWKLIKITTTKAQRKLFFNIKNLKRNIKSFSLTDMENLSKKLNINLKDIIFMNQNLSSVNVSLTTYNDHIYQINNNTQNIYLNIEKSDYMKKITSILKQTILNLDTKYKTIIKKRWLSQKKNTLKELSKDYNISIERTRQIEKKSIKILQTKINFCN
ncbi:MAG: RNA polymerase factor sigma-32 [Candidatus Azosocius agrarius]|nr:MAG: RNA polymerase factor sigma-32 [Gammaproteobacteria bacterium]